MNCVQNVKRNKRGTRICEQKMYVIKNKIEKL